VQAGAAAATALSAAQIAQFAADIPATDKESPAGASASGGLSKIKSRRMGRQCRRP
jgi:hypothetical protein